MDEATDFMALAAHCRRLARSEPDARVREKLSGKAREYDSQACARLMIFKTREVSI